MTLLMYGEIPTVERTTLADDALASQGTIITTDDTGWQIGDQVQVGKQYSSATINTTLHTIQSISGTTIVLTPNLSTATRKAGGAVIRMNGYGIVYKSDNDSNIVGYFRSPSHLFIQGVQFLATVLNHGNSGGYATCEDVGLRSKHTVRNCSAQFVTASNIFAQTTPPEDGIDFLNLNFFRSGLGTLYVGSTASQGRSGAYKFDNNVVIGSAVLSSIASAAKLNIIVTNNVFENGSGAFFINAVNPTITGNKFWGSSVTTGHLRIGVLVGGTIKNNTFNKNIVAVGLDPAPTIGVTLKDFVFGDETANTDDIQFSPDAYVDVTLESPTGVPVISETYLPETVDGSMLKVTDTNNVENVDTVYLTYGKYYRTGYGLADTTVWTGQAFGVASVGQFGLCLESKDPTNLLKYQDNNPKETTIGNCQNLNVSVVARIKINNAAFYAGTHTKPTLRVTYDDGTEITSVAQATTDDQLLSVNFSPTTAKESIKIELEMATDAITTDAYVYLGKLAVAKAEGVMIDTTTMSKWSAGLPLGTLRTFQSPESPLDALLVNHQIAGSVGKQLKDGLTEDNFLALK